jgi:hypothetical protein
LQKCVIPERKLAKHLRSWRLPVILNNGCNCYCEFAGVSKSVITENIKLVNLEVRRRK